MCVRHPKCEIGSFGVLKFWVGIYQGVVQMAKNANKEVSNGKGVGLVADVDITNEPLPVQTLCWELLDLIQSAEDWDIEFSDWTKKAEKLPFYNLPYFIRKAC